MKSPRQLSLFRSSPGAAKAAKVAATVVAHGPASGPVGVTLAAPRPILTGRLSDQGLEMLRPDFDYYSLGAIDAPEVVPSGGVRFMATRSGSCFWLSQVAFRG